MLFLTLRVFLADGPALGTQEFSFAWGPSCGAWDGQGSTELSHCHQSRRPLQGGVREWRLLAVTTNSLNLKTTPPMALIEKKLILIRKRKKKDSVGTSVVWYSNISQLFSQFLVNITEHSKAKPEKWKKNVNEMYESCFHKCFHSQLNISLGLSVVF